MTRTVYVNGEYLPETEAKVSIFDRGFLMADAVYEVTSVLGGKLLDFQGHTARLQRSLNELQMISPVTMDELLEIHHQLIEKTILKKVGSTFRSPVVRVRIGISSGRTPKRSRVASYCLPLPRKSPRANRLMRGSR
jgi:Branched-chain amino acid aminotransferase/4-amino-4-deoxychorismate lyase